MSAPRSRSLLIRAWYTPRHCAILAHLEKQPWSASCIVQCSACRHPSTSLEAPVVVVSQDTSEDPCAECASGCSGGRSCEQQPPSKPSTAPSRGFTALSPASPSNPCSSTGPVLSLPRRLTYERPARRQSFLDKLEAWVRAPRVLVGQYCRTHRLNLVTKAQAHIARGHSGWNGHRALAARLQGMSLVDCKVCAHHTIR